MLTRGARKVFRRETPVLLLRSTRSHRQIVFVCVGRLVFVCVGRLARRVPVRGWLSVSLDDMAKGVSSREGSFESVVNARSPSVAYGLKTVLLYKEQP